jgi:parallel beta-helix repeat protein
VTKQVSMKKFILLFLVSGLTLGLQAQLAGIYTIDGTAPSKKTNFNSINDAIDALRFQELEGDVTFMLKDAEYFQPLVLESVYNELGYNVHFTASADEKVHLTNDGLSLLVSNSSNLSFSNIKFQAISTEMSSMVMLSNSSNITIEQNEFNSSEDDASFKKISSSSHDNLIEENTFKGTGGITIERLSNNNVIVNNKLYFQANGIEVLSALNTSIEGNTLQAMNKETSQGILIDGFVGELNIASNAILNVNQGIAQEVTYRPSTEKVTGNIVNNVIESDGNSISLNNNVDKLKIAFNTINSRTGSVLVVNEEIKGSMDNISLFANNLINEDEIVIMNISSDKFLTNTDYNNIYNEDGFFSTKVGSTESSSIDEWKANMNADHAISADPLFIANGGKQYLLSDRSPCIDAGPDAFEIGVLADFDGDKRGEVTEIGADEFNKFAFDEILNQIQLAQSR